MVFFFFSAMEGECNNLLFLLIKRNKCFPFALRKGSFLSFFCRCLFFFQYFLFFSMNRRFPFLPFAIKLFLPSFSKPVRTQRLANSRVTHILFSHLKYPYRTIIYVGLNWDLMCCSGAAYIMTLILGGESPVRPERNEPAHASTSQ